MFFECYGNFMCVLKNNNNNNVIERQNYCMKQDASFAYVFRYSIEMNECRSSFIGILVTDIRISLLVVASS